MPKLPEVETIKRDLEPLEGTRIRSVTVHDDKLVAGTGSFEADVTGCSIESFQRRGKYLLARGHGAFLLFSLRMTGTLTLSEPSNPPERRVDFNLGERTVYFTTVRRFSRVHYYEEENPDAVDKISKLGVEPLNGDFSSGYLEESFSNRTAAVKSLLMNQEIIAGIGNIYANEICFEAGVDPSKSVTDVTGQELKSIVRATPTVLQKAIESRGSSISDYNRPEGDDGRFQDEFMVYGR
ncbi:MAG: Fpg/Nei family DNA glycosylase, partial [bacterium]